MPVFAQHIYRIGGGFRAPVPVFKVQPQSTEEARGRKVGGTVLMKLVVDEKGVPKSIEVLRRTPSSAQKVWDYGLKGKAVEALEQ